LLTQATAYKGIKERKPPITRESTKRNIELTTAAILNYTGSRETEAAIWQGLRRASIRPRISQFLYKTMHSTQKIGQYWDHIPGYQDRQTCHPCGRTESMEHILITCEETPTRMIWQMAKEIWPAWTYEWPEISLGTILGCGTITSLREIAHPNEQQVDQDRRARNTKGPTRLMQIIITESAHLLWVLRCKRVIQEKRHSRREIESRWQLAINARLMDDKITATKIKRDKTFTNLVKAT